MAEDGKNNGGKHQGRRNEQSFADSVESKVRWRKRTNRDGSLVAWPATNKSLPGGFESSNIKLNIVKFNGSFSCVLSIHGSLPTCDQRDEYHMYKITVPLRGEIEFTEDDSLIFDLGKVAVLLVYAQHITRDVPANILNKQKGALRNLHQRWITSATTFLDRQFRVHRVGK